ncbi:Uncharacterised protein [Mycobacterium tuberculosis]|nr:Uncharacterised protein [Mycobacterium tuberculosis]
MLLKLKYQQWQQKLRSLINSYSVMYQNYLGVNNKG